MVDFLGSRAHRDTNNLPQLFSCVNKQETEEMREKQESGNLDDKAISQHDEMKK